jgi:outer membrane murein-binding lipoprotein Lpp
MKFTNPIRDSIIIVLIFAVVVLLFTKGCGGNSDKFKALQAEAKSLREKVAQDSITRARERVTERDKIFSAGQQTAAAISEKHTSDKKVKELQGRVAGLANSLRLHSSVTYVIDSANCEELAAQSLRLSAEVDGYRKEADEAINLLNYEVLLRDSVIEKEVGYSDSLRADFNRQSTLLKTALATGKPRGKFLAGAGIIGNQTTFLSGAKVAIAYQTKGGKQYQAEGMIVRGEVYYGGSVLIQLFK